MKPIQWIILFSIMTLLLQGTGRFVNAEPDEEEPAPKVYRSIGVMPFFMGRWNPKTKDVEQNMLACSLAQVCAPDPSIRLGADRAMTRMVFDWLKIRFDRELVPLERSREVYMQLAVDLENDTPRKLTMDLGKMIGADLIVTGTVWRYRERGGVDGFPDSPASVGFVIYLLDVETGTRIWQGIFDGFQKSLTSISLRPSLNKEGSLKWLSANELAKRGVNTAMKQFPTNLEEIQPPIPGADENVSTGAAPAEKG